MLLGDFGAGLLESDALSSTVSGVLSGQDPMSMLANAGMALAGGESLSVVCYDSQSI